MLYYIHGYMSEPNSTKGLLFKEKLNAKAIKYRDCEPQDIIISECIARIKNEIKNDENVILIGSSLGGFLAAEVALENKNVKKLILLNPAIIPPSVDITKIQDMPQRILSDIQDKRLFEEKIYSDIFILIGLNDDLIPLNWPIEFALAQKTTINFFYDDHRFTKNMKQLPKIIDSMLFKESGSSKNESQVQ